MTSILVCDPNSDTAEMYAVGLSLDGFAPLIASDCDEALGHLGTYPVSALVVDGRALARDRGGSIKAVGAQAVWRNIPVLVIADWVDAAIVREARELACRAVVLKPCTPDSLVALVRAAMCDSELRRAIPSTV